MSVVISSGFQDIKLADDSQWSAGRKRFFEDIMTELQRADEEWCASLVIGRKLDKAAAYFTAQDCLITIVMPEGTATYDENTKEIRFADEDKWVCFVHEASHFMHMVVDGVAQAASYALKRIYIDMNEGKLLCYNMEEDRYE